MYSWDDMAQDNTKQYCKFEKFIIPLFFFHINQISNHEYFCLADEPTKASHTFPKESPFTFVFSTISVNTSGFWIFFSCAHNDCCSSLSLKQQSVLTQKTS